MSTLAPRASLVRYALMLECEMVTWNVVEGLVAVVAALASGSIVLLGFGVDSFVKTASLADCSQRRRVRGAQRSRRRWNRERLRWL